MGIVASLFVFNEYKKSKNSTVRTRVTEKVATFRIKQTDAEAKAKVDVLAARNEATEKQAELKKAMEIEDGSERREKLAALLNGI